MLRCSKARRTQRANDCLCLLFGSAVAAVVQARWHKCAICHALRLSFVYGGKRLSRQAKSKLKVRCVRGFARLRRRIDRRQGAREGRFCPCKRLFARCPVRVGRCVASHACRRNVSIDSVRMPAKTDRFFWSCDVLPIRERSGPARIGPENCRRTMCPRRVWRYSLLFVPACPCSLSVFRRRVFAQRARRVWSPQADKLRQF